MIVRVKFPLAAENVALIRFAEAVTDTPICTPDAFVSAMVGIIAVGMPKFVVVLPVNAKRIAILATPAALSYTLAPINETPDGTVMVVRVAPVGSCE